MSNEQSIKLREYDLRDEREVSDSQLPTHEPLLLGQDRLQDGVYALDLIAVPLDGAGNLLGVIHREPGDLAEIGALAGCLEVKPLELLVLLVSVHGNREVLVVFIDQVLDYGVRLPVV